MEPTTSHESSSFESDETIQTTFLKNNWLALLTIVSTSGLGLLFALYPVFDKSTLPPRPDQTGLNTLELPDEFSTDDQSKIQTASANATDQLEVEPAAFFVHENETEPVQLIEFETNTAASQLNRPMPPTGGDQTEHSKPVRLLGIIETEAATE